MNSIEQQNPHYNKLPVHYDARARNPRKKRRHSTRLVIVYGTAVLLPALRELGFKRYRHYPPRNVLKVASLLQGCTAQKVL